MLLFSETRCRFNTLPVFKQSCRNVGRGIFYKLTKSTEKNVFVFEIRKLTAECRIAYQLLGLSGL